MSATDRLGGARVIHAPGHIFNGRAFFADGPLLGRVIDTWLPDTHVAGDGTIYHLYRVGVAREGREECVIFYYREAGSVRERAGGTA